MGLTALAIGAVVAFAPRPPATDAASTLTAWTPNVPLRGIDLSPKTLSRADYDALELIRPGSVVVFSAQLGDPDPVRWIESDPQLQRWLQRHQDVLQIVRMWPVRGPDDPRRLAQRIVSLHKRFPWIKWFQIANEPDIEWAASHRRSWQDIARWSTDVWWHVERLRRNVRGADDVKLLFPPLAQGSPMAPETVGYDALRPAIELYLDHGDGIAGHEYWDRDDVYLVEDRWPTWLQERLASVPFFVTEAGRRPLLANGMPDDSLGAELVQFAAQTKAQVVAPFVLSSPGGSFDQFDFVGRDGVPRPQLFVWSARGP